MTVELELNYIETENKNMVINVTNERVQLYWSESERDIAWNQCIDFQGVCL